MRFKSIAFMGCAAVIALAPQAFAMAGRHHGRGDGPGSGGEHFTRSVTLTRSGDTGNGKSGGGGSMPLSAAEPLSAFAVGLGLIGARLLRRRA
jgi:hypothetical protein